MKLPLEPSEYIRVLRLVKQPDSEELSQVTKIAGGGLALIGFIGFVMFMVMSYIPM